MFSLFLMGEEIEYWFMHGLSPPALNDDRGVVGVFTVSDLCSVTLKFNYGVISIIEC